MKSLLKQKFPALWALIAFPVAKWRVWRSNFQLERTLFSCAIRDYLSFRQFSGFLQSRAKVQTRAAKLRKNYHRIEKGLALPDPRPGFGASLIRELWRDIVAYEKAVGCDDLAKATRASLAAYLSWHEENGHLEAIDKENIKLLQASTGAGIPIVATDAGIFHRSREDLQNASRGDFSELLRSRHSIRVFAETPVSRDLLDEAVEMALLTPSACNRQGWSVFAFDDKVKIKRLLHFQNGNRGFGEHLAALLIVCGDQAAFPDPLERNQAFVDGGMFSMTLLEAVHFKGLGACSLNLSIGSGRKKELFEEAGIPERFVPIMMIGVGNLPDQVPIARSLRRARSEILLWP